MSRPLFVSVALVLLAPTADARPWQGIIPGVSSTIDVIGKFGAPSRQVTERGYETALYAGARAIKGTVQAQFKANAHTHVVERIDVFPAPVITVQEIEASYGGPCKPLDASGDCYHRKATAAGRQYFLYAKAGLAIFFQDDGATVRSFAFLPVADAPR